MKAIATKVCPVCEEKLPHNALVCPLCLHEFSPVAGVTSEDSEVNAALPAQRSEPTKCSSGPLKSCPSCKARVHTGHPKCEVCGYKFADRWVEHNEITLSVAAFHDKVTKVRDTERALMILREDLYTDIIHDPSPELAEISRQFAEMARACCPRL